MLITAFVILRSLFLPYAKPAADQSPARSSLDVLDEVFKVMSTLPLLEQRVPQITIQCMHVMSVVLSEGDSGDLQSSKHELLGLAPSPGVEQTVPFCRRGVEHPTTRMPWPADRRPSRALPCSERWGMLPVGVGPQRCVRRWTKSVFSKVIHCLGD